MKALVTGATGFVGPHLVAHLRSCGDDIVLPGDERGTFNVADRDAVLDTFTRERPEVVYHLAALSHVGASWQDPIRFLRVNVEGTRNVVDASIATGVRRVLVVGSAEEYGRVDTHEPIDEDAPLRPLTPYGATKIAASFVGLQAFLGSGLEVIRARPFSHTGPGQAPDFVVPALARRVAAAERDGADHIRAGSLDPVRDLSDVRDVVRAYRLLVERGEAGEVYNVCRGAGTTIAEIANRMVARAAKPLDVEIDPDLVRPVEVPYLVGNATKIHEATGWGPEIALDDTLDALLADARAELL